MVVSTAIVMIISVVVLTALFLVFKDNFKVFKDNTDNILDTSEGTTIKQACDLACKAENKIIYCCKEYDLQKEKVMCGDSRLEIGCDLSCEGFDCGNYRS